ncbi:uncharacterized protein LOC131075241 isoform X1 [Cryptomeria japonica]|uniref:uncharacterized protein LOC131075241 isoform X1 n=1 Tax=Cryptomeria japonica TaxID=3369 RepID=UPI0027DA6CDF|nr:uncharacterized protein LOC131075241 isoform X1 [Cryptomeria japonica]
MNKSFLDFLQLWASSHCRKISMSGSQSQSRYQPFKGNRQRNRNDLNSRNANWKSAPRSNNRFHTSHLQSAGQIERWLNDQDAIPTTHLISYLSSDEGRHALTQIVDNRSLPFDIVLKLAKLVTRDDIRGSLQKHDTNRIYGVFVGSAFLTQIQAHVANMVRPKAKDIWPFLHLYHELQSRTEDGWKFVAVEALKEALDGLREDDEKREIYAEFLKLVEYRDKLKRLQFLAKSEEASQESIRTCAIIPSEEEIACPRPREAPINRVCESYNSVDEYLSIQFYLIREDCFASLRRAIQDFRKNLIPSNIRRYTKVKFLRLQVGNEGVEHCISFEVSKKKAVNWSLSRSLLFGSLLCISCDGFRTYLWGIVKERQEKGILVLKLIPSSDGGPVDLQIDKTYEMIESTSAYFEAYHHVLKCLQRFEMEELPFSEHLLSLQPHVLEPSYVQQRKQKDAYDFQSAFPNISRCLGTGIVRILREVWPRWDCSLDESQMEAVKQGITKRLVLIQGPPGTGKTYVGLKIATILLSNVKRGPILVICYTNHALDQFLESIYSIEPNVIRLGSRSSNEIMQKRTLKELRRGITIPPSLRIRYRELMQTKTNLQQQIQRCMGLMNQQHVSKKMLRKMSLEQCIQSLDPNDEISHHLQKMWLEEIAEQAEQRKRQSKGKQKVVETMALDTCNTFSSLVDQPDETTESAEPDSDKSSIDEESRDYATGEEGLIPRDEDATASTMRVMPSDEDANAEEALLADEDATASAMRLMTEDEDATASTRGVMSADEDATAEEALSADGDATANAMRVMPADEDASFSALGVMPADECSTDVLSDEILCSKDDWILAENSRMKLLQYWLDQIRERNKVEFQRITEAYKNVCSQLQQLDDEISLHILRKANVIGMTTTAAAKNYDILQGLRAEIVIIEEAAEVLEASILPCIGSFTKHLILLGDHLQLRPSVAEYELATKHKLEISLFERLIKGGVEHVALRCQRRMRPSISELISDIYPSLKDHDSVQNFENIKGIQNNVFFLDHKAMESETSEASSKVNVKEAWLIVEFCLYLLRQGYENSDITILTMYKGQMSEIQKNLKDRILSRTKIERMDPETLKTPRVCSVDNYQGEECKIIILSLVRSNKMYGVGGSKGNIGFLKVSNRVCVALSRAKMGLYIFGNAELLASKSDLWESVIQKLGSAKSIGPALSLACQNHPQTETKVSQAEDFRLVEDGGCSRPCEYQLECGHACPRRCHPSNHDRIICPKPCPNKFDNACGHQCTVICHFPEDCPPCRVPIPKVLPNCGHQLVLHCSSPVEDALCIEPCDVIFDCGHPCRSKCGRPCPPCRKLVMKDLPCGHKASLPCCDDPANFSCKEPCGKVRSPGCEHICRGTCASCKQGTSHIPCKERCSRDLPCGHQCMAGCSETCPPCMHRCEKRCLHSRCTRLCGALCIPCKENCEWNCQHHTCDRLCHEICSRNSCDEPCQEILSCGHTCIGLCGEPCPKFCRTCHPNHLDVITQMTLEEYESTDRFVQLIDCEHVFEVSGLDTWMNMDEKVLEAEPGAVAVKLKQCPECRTPIRKSLRYSNIVKERLQQIEEVKKLILGFEYLNKGNKMLKEKSYDKAIQEFSEAFRHDPGSLEAHLGMAKALCGLKDYERTTEHLFFILERSSYKARIQEKLPELISKFASSITNVNFGTSNDRNIKAENELAIETLLQWVSVPICQDLKTGLTICEIILEQTPGHVKTEEIKRNLESGQRALEEVVNVITREVGGKGHWYKCPNGHFYVVGECGGPMQKSKCPDCNAVVGGESHQPAEGNSHADIDGSSHPAWGNATGLAGLNNLL